MDDIIGEQVMITNLLGLLLAIVILVAWGGPLVGVYPEGYETGVPADSSVSGNTGDQRVGFSYGGPRVPTSHGDYTQQQQESTQNNQQESSQNNQQNSTVGTGNSKSVVSSQNQATVVEQNQVEDHNVYEQRAEYYRCIGVCVDFHGKSCGDCQEQCKR